MELLYCPLGKESVFMNPFNPDFRLTDLEKALKYGDGVDSSEAAKVALQRKKDVIIRGVLSVTVISAEDLPATDLMGKSDPFVVVIMKKSEQKNKTRVNFWFLNCFHALVGPKRNKLHIEKLEHLIQLIPVNH